MAYPNRNLFLTHVNYGCKWGRASAPCSHLGTQTDRATVISNLDTVKSAHGKERKWRITQKVFMSQASHPHAIGQNQSYDPDSCKGVWKMCPGAKQNGFYWLALQSLLQFYAICYKLTSKQFSSLQLTWPIHFFLFLAMSCPPNFTVTSASLKETALFSIVFIGRCCSSC